MRSLTRIPREEVFSSDLSIEPVIEHALITVCRVILVAVPEERAEPFSGVELGRSVMLRQRMVRRNEFRIHSSRFPWQQKTILYTVFHLIHERRSHMARDNLLFDEIFGNSPSVDRLDEIRGPEITERILL